MNKDRCPECGKEVGMYCECPPTICLNEDCQAQLFPGEEGYGYSECIECGSATDV